MSEDTKENCECRNWCSDHHEMDNEHHHNCKHWTQSKTPNLRHETFGRLMLEHLITQLPDFLGDEWAEDIMPLAEQAGLCVWTAYEPDIHGEIDAEEGAMIWYWGTAGERQLTNQ
jgi:hypothetical protein